MNTYSVILLNALPDKKIKSLGNKCLINITKHTNILDHHITTINSIFKKPEIIVVGGFESKKLKKYIETNYSNIKYTDHNLDNSTNIGTSITTGMKLVTGNHCFIINSSFIIGKNIISTIKNNLNASFILTSSNNFGVGCILNNELIGHCYYDLPSNHPLDIINIGKYDMDKFNKICNTNIQKLFFFELINMCVNNNICLRSINIPKKSFVILDGMNSINKIKNKTYV